MATEGRLTKSHFRRGLDCPRRLWLDTHRADLRPPIGLVAQQRIETGRAIEALARRGYPHGVQVVSRDPILALAETQEHLRNGTPCLFEAAFAAGGRYARTDVLHRDPNGIWTVDECKSSTVKEPAKIREELLYDLAFQVHVVRKAGLPVGRARLILVRNDYVWDGGEYDPEAMLAPVDVTTIIENLVSSVEDLALELMEALNRPDEPVVETNTHCKDCDYLAHCHRDTPADDLIFLPRITAPQLRNLRADGYATLRDLPESLLRPAWRRMREAMDFDGPRVLPGLADRLAEVDYPAAFIDYETCNPAFPLFPGLSPYQHLCFQWSAHVQEAPGSPVVHHEFLGVPGEDPRTEFCRRLWEVVRDCRSIIHYTGFEEWQLRPMVTDAIPHAEDLLALVRAHSFDLHKVVSEYVDMAAFRGRTSIKVVLPALVPDLRYDDMLVADGQMAGAAYIKLQDPTLPTEEAATLRDALLAYCRQDTLAMVRIYEELVRLADA